MTKEEALDAMWMRCQHNDKTFEAYCVLKRELGLNELDGGDRVKHELKTELNELGVKYCDRNICLSNEYNGISCDECDVMKSQEPCEDCISREKTMQIVRKWFDRDAAPSDLKNEIEQLPPVNPKQSEGHWIVRVFPGEHPFFAERYYCSVCGDWQTHGTLKYCPNCGARMSGEVETE